MANNIIKSEVSKAFNLPQPESEITSWLVLEGEEYELRSFTTEFGQETDYKGQPQHEVKGGLLYLSFYQLPNEKINNWMLNSGVSKNGEIQFRKSASNMPLRIKFTGAQCINYQKEMGTNNIGFDVKIILSPKEVSLNDTTHSNEW